jgi:hypothetical protein
MPSILPGLIEMFYCDSLLDKCVSDLSIFRTAVVGFEWELYRAMSSAYSATEMSGGMVLRRCAV